MGLLKSLDIYAKEVIKPCSEGNIGCLTQFFRHEDDATGKKVTCGNGVRFCAKKRTSNDAEAGIGAQKNPQLSFQRNANDEMAVP